MSLEGLEQELAEYANHEARRSSFRAPVTRGALTCRPRHTQVVRDILRSEGAELRERANAVEGKLHQARAHPRRAPDAPTSTRALTCAHQVELDSIQDYVAESDNLVALQHQIRGCDSILGKMESLLGGFQSDLGKISSEARTSSQPPLRAPAHTRAAPTDQVAARAIVHNVHQAAQPQDR